MFSQGDNYACDPDETMASAGCGRPVCLEDYRQWQENEKQWLARREFLARHMHLYPGPRMDQLVALSMVWSNVVFIGNRYGEALTQKVHQMAEGIDIGEMPSFELVPGAKKRPASPSADGEQVKKKFGPRPRFQPLRFVSSTIEEDNSFLKTDKKQDYQTPFDHFQTAEPETPASELCFPPINNMEEEHYSDPEEDSSPYICDPNAMDEQRRPDFGQFMKDTEQSYLAKFESHASSLGKDFRSKVLDSWKGVNRQGRKGIGFVKPPKQPAFNRNPRPPPPKAQSVTSVEVVKKLSSIVQENMKSAQKQKMPINLTSFISQSVQACKTNPEYIYASVPNPALRPGKWQGPRTIMACEVRCMNVYLATGYGVSKLKARDHAIDMAIRLLMEPSIDVTAVKRKCGNGYRDDAVAFSTVHGIKEPPPFIKEMEELSGHQEEARETSNSLADFVIVDGPDAICRLQMSSDSNRMSVEYRYDSMAGNMWRCCVYVAGQYVAEAFGCKKTSKQSAAEAAIMAIKTMQLSARSNAGNACTSGVPASQAPAAYNPATESSDASLCFQNEFVICERSTDAISTLCGSAQFNRVQIDFTFEFVEGQNWRCKVLLNGQFVASAVDFKKSVKRKAAEAALNILKKTNPVVVSNSANGPDESSISRQQILGSAVDAGYKQVIQEDNVGNRLLRKMGWTGGGLGKEGEGIAEPIKVKEQSSRGGLGLQPANQKFTRKNVETLIRDYISSCSEEDLTFSNELTNEERKLIHAVASKYQLKSKSYGKGQNRYLVISRKMNKEDLLMRLKEQGQFGSYAMVTPQN